MAKIPKLHIAGALFYVTSRGDNNEDIFKDAEDYAAYGDLIKKYKEQYQCRLFAFSLLPNHAHLFLELKVGVTISDIMHDLNANYTKYFNAKYQRKGHLFQERNKIAIVEKDSYLLNVSAYIHLNASALKPQVIPAEYPYSSLPLYMGLQPDLRLASLVGTEEIKEVVAKCHAPTYKEYLAGVTPQAMQELSLALRKNQIMGSDEFVAKVNQKAQEHKAKLMGRESGPGQRNFLVAGGVAIIIVGAFAFFLYQKSAALKERLNKATAQQETALSQRMVQERIKISRDLDEKYRADKVSYAAMAKRLELEKNKVKQLESKR